MKNLKKNINNVLIKIINNVKTDYILCGSISDYFHFIKHDIDISDKISDIDIISYDMNIIIELENIFKIEPILVKSPNEEAVSSIKKFKLNHYYIPINNTHIDIFLGNENDVKLIKTNKTDFKYHQITIVSEFNRYIQLDSTINFWYNTAPMTKRLLKYLKKRMIYNKILNNET